MRGKQAAVCNVLMYCWDGQRNAPEKAVQKYVAFARHDIGQGAPILEFCPCAQCGQVGLTQTLADYHRVGSAGQGPASPRALTPCWPGSRIAFARC